MIRFSKISNQLSHYFPESSLQSDIILVTTRHITQLLKRWLWDLWETLPHTPKQWHESLCSPWCRLPKMPEHLQKMSNEKMTSFHFCFVHEGSHTHTHTRGKVWSLSSDIAVTPHRSEPCTLHQSWFPGRDRLRTPRRVSLNASVHEERDQFLTPSSPPLPPPFSFQSFHY